MFATFFLLLFQASTGQGSNAELTPQQLIDIAPPGSVVTLPSPGDTSDPSIYYPRWSLRIDKPLTLIGNGTRTRNLFLEGPGSGEVVLHGFVVEHRHWCINNCTDVYEWAPHGPYEGAVISTGFDSVRLYDCTVDGRMEVYGANLVTLERAGPGVWDDYPAVTAPGATVVLLDSQPYSFRGNPGIYDVAAVYCAMEQLYCNAIQVMPDSIPAARFGSNLTMTGSSRLGGRLDFDWRAFGYGILWADVGVRAPRAAWGGAWNFLGDSPTFVLLARRAVVPIPVSRGLIGLEVTFQATDFGGRYSRPAFALIRP